MGMQSNGGKDRRMLSEINVTPLVDVTLVLLIIFMVTTPMLQRGRMSNFRPRRHRKSKRSSASPSR